MLTTQHANTYSRTWTFCVVIKECCCDQNSILLMVNNEEISWYNKISDVTDEVSRKTMSV